MKDWSYRIAAMRGTLLAALVFIVLFGVYISKNEAGLTPAVANTAANKAVLLAIVAMAQTLPILTGGLDLSVGMVFVLTNCISSALLAGSPLKVLGGAVVVLAAGLACGVLNGLVIIYGRLQPIIATLATGAIYYGFALWLRPNPGGDINSDIADIVTGVGPGGIPVMLVVLLAVVLLIWVPFRYSPTGRAALGIGSAQGPAYMSGLPIDRVKLATYALAGLLSGIAGLLLTFVTYSGEASSVIGSSYTLNSIAAVVIGGTALAGGAGSAVGSIFGAMILRTIGDLLFVFDFDPLWQPLFQGVILLVAVSLGAVRLIGLRDRLDLFA